MSQYMLIAVFVVYIGCIWKKFGILPSISDSWYELDKASIWFTLFMVGLCHFMIMISFETSNALLFISGGCLGLTGVAAEFRQKMTSTLHYIGAVGGIGFAFAGVIMDGPHLLFAILTGAYLVLAVLMRIFKVSNVTWWVETLAFIFLMPMIMYNLNTLKS